MRVSIASLLAVNCAVTLPQKIIRGRSWGTCNLSAFPEVSGIPSPLVAVSLRWAKMAQFLDWRVEPITKDCHRLLLCPTQEGIAEMDAVLSSLAVIRARW
jgi:hypothetical protein